MRDASNKDQLTSFCEKLGTQLRQCLKCNRKKFDRDTIWGLYHQLRTSEGFVKDWSQLAIYTHSSISMSPMSCSQS